MIQLDIVKCENELEETIEYYATGTSSASHFHGNALQRIKLGHPLKTISSHEHMSFGHIFHSHLVSDRISNMN